MRRSRSAGSRQSVRGSHLGEHHRGAEGEALQRRGPVGQARADDLVAEADAAGVHRAVDGRRAASCSRARSAGPARRRTPARTRRSRPMPDMARRRSTSSTASSSSRVTMGQSKRSPGSRVTAFGPPNRASFSMRVGSFPRGRIAHTARPFGQPPRVRVPCPGEVGMAELHEDLGNGMVMRGLRDEADARAFVALNDEVTREGPICDRLVHHRPGGGRQDFFVVEDTRTGRVASTTCLLPWQLDFCGIPLRMAMLEMVVTRPAYRKLGLVRSQVAVFHRIVDERAMDLCIIQGIPWYYRQFGYAYALDHRPRLRLAAAAIPDAWEPGTLEAAGDRDVAVLQALYDGDGPVTVDPRGARRGVLGVLVEARRDGVPSAPRPRGRHGRRVRGLRDRERRAVRGRSGRARRTRRAGFPRLGETPGSADARDLRTAARRALACGPGARRHRTAVRPVPRAYPRPRALPAAHDTRDRRPAGSGGIRPARRCPGDQPVQVRGPYALRGRPARRRGERRVRRRLDGCRGPRGPAGSRPTRSSVSPWASAASRSFATPGPSCTCGPRLPNSSTPSSPGCPRGCTCRIEEVEGGSPAAARPAAAKRTSGNPRRWPGPRREGRRGAGRRVRERRAVRVREGRPPLRARRHRLPVHPAGGHPHSRGNRRPRPAGGPGRRGVRAVPGRRPRRAIPPGARRGSGAAGRRAVRGALRPASWEAPRRCACATSRGVSGPSRPWTSRAACAARRCCSRRWPPTVCMTVLMRPPMPASRATW